MSDIQCVFEGMAGKGSIYISNFKAAQDITLLQTKGIKAILSVARSGLVYHKKENIPYYLYIPADDHEEYEIYKHFNQTFEFIEQARKDTNVLVHCMVGVSRSVTIVMAYLLKKYKSSLKQVISMLQRKRRKINPNKGFIEQLKKYAQEEGLKCDFMGVEVPEIKERSRSRQSRILSASLDLKENQNYLLSKPHGFNDKKVKNSQNLIEKTVETKADSKELNKSAQKKLTITQYAFAEKLIEMGEMTTSPRLKRMAVSQKKQQLNKKLSIEQKINRVRQKLLKERQPVSNNRRNNSIGPPSLQNINKENKRKQQSTNNEEEHRHSNKIVDYFHLYSKNNPIAELLQKQKAESMDVSKQNSNIKNDIFKDFKLEESNIYEKLQISKQKKRIGKGNF